MNGSLLGKKLTGMMKFPVWTDSGERPGVLKQILYYMILPYVLSIAIIFLSVQKLLLSIESPQLFLILQVLI